MERVMADCRRFESESDCSLTIIGDEEEVVAAASQHAAAVHGHEDNDEMREMIRSGLEPASEYQPSEREKETLPSS